MIYPPQLFRSFLHALRGVRIAFRSEQSFRLQVLAAVIVIIVAALVHVRPTEWIILFLLIGSVLILELLNSVLERIMDTFKPRLHPAIHDMKDMMAAVVLMASLFAAVIGATILWPYVARLFE